MFCGVFAATAISQLLIVGEIDSAATIRPLPLFRDQHFVRVESNGDLRLMAKSPIISRRRAAAFLFTVLSVRQVELSALLRPQTAQSDGRR